MPSYSTIPPESFASFERGIDREDPRTDIAKGGYEYAENVLLRDQFQGGTHIASMLADIPYDLGAVNAGSAGGTPTYVAPFTYSTYSSGTLSFSTHLVVASTAGLLARLDTSGTPAATLVRRGLNATQKYWTHAVYDQWLVLCNGRDAPMKYGQHFLVDSMTEARPFAFPLGSKPVTPCGAAISTETWTGGTFVADASVPGGGSRVHTHSLSTGSSSNAYVEWATVRNFLSGPYPYGGTDFTDTDFLVCQVFNSAATSSVRIRFGYTGGTEYFQWTVSVPASASWQTLRLQVSDAVWTVSPVAPETTAEAQARVAAAVKRLTFFNDSVNTVYFDDCYFLYGNAPPAFQVATYHKGRILGGGAPIAGSAATPALGTLFWSRVAFPDEYPAANTLPISGGSNAISRANQITAMHEFGPSVLIGTPHSITSFTLDSSGNPVQQAVTNEHGIDSHRAMVETPNGALIFPWQKGMYVIRATWRALGSNKVAPLFDFVWQVEPQWTIGVYDEKTQTLRWWFRLTVDASGAPLEDDPDNTNFGIVFDYVRAQELGEGVWPAKMTYTMADFAFPFYIEGNREVVYGQYNNNTLYRMGVAELLDDDVEEGGRYDLHSEVVLPWMAKEDKDKLGKWVGLVVPYAAREPVAVWVRFASHPQQFDTAVWTAKQLLPAGPNMVDEQARVLLGETSRWVQVKFTCEKARGMEIYPPIAMVGLTTSRQP